MNYTPKELENMQIRKDLVYGYSRDQVDKMITKISQDYRVYIKENEELRKEVDNLQQSLYHYKRIEEALQHTLVLAQQTGENIKNTAQEKADKILRDADTGAQKILKDANRQVTRVNAEYETLKENLQSFKIKSQSMLGTLQDLLKSSFDDLGE
jgi:Cell division initiation protein